MALTLRCGMTLALLLLAVPESHAQSATAGTPVAATHLAAEGYPTVISDGAGGAFVGFKVAWRSESLPAEIAVARLLPSAGRHPEWATLPPPPAGSMFVNQFAPTRVLAGSSNRAFSFSDFTQAPQPNVHFVRRMEADGIDPGFGTYAPQYTYAKFCVLPRSDGGATVISKLNGSVNCLVTIVSPTGSAIEQFTPIPFNAWDILVLSGDRVVAVPSGGDGAIAILWAAGVSGTSSQIDLFAVKLDANGNTMWDPVHRTITAAAKDQTEDVATTDDADGAIVAWKDDRTLASQPDIYAVRLLPNGNVASGWTPGGKAISAAVRPQYAAQIERDGAGGAWIAWTDERDTLSGPDVYFTHVLASGSIATGFATNGRALCNVTGPQTNVQITRDGSGGLFAVWLDARDGETDLYAQHLDAIGNPTSGWAAGGNPVCTDGTAQGQPSVSWVSNGRAIVAWKDARTGTDVVYAAALDAARGVLDVPRAVASRLALAPGANPARGAIELKLDAAEAGEVTVTLFDVGGRVRSSRVVAGGARDASVRFGALEPGLYFASAAQRDSRTSTKVVVVR